MAHETTAEAALDIREFGAPVDGNPQPSDRRLYLQLQAFGGCTDLAPLIQSLDASGAEGVLYRDINDPKGVALLLINEDPSDFLSFGDTLVNKGPFAALKQKPELTMLGRTYSSGREPNLEDWLLNKPRRNALNAEWPWAIWYPLRRRAEFALLPAPDQGKILYEHAKIGMSYGRAGYAHDIRLACHGLDKNDNEFVIGLVGSELYPLSRIVQDMRKTQQTSKYIQSLGPFFVGKAIWQSALK
ncbi:MAG: chlorite dismutase family protein [Candidatus Omnitrophota bacterium]|nr:chlorite dismutase family protein [Candidatus Omnitrophota bacterium]